MEVEAEMEVEVIPGPSQEPRSPRVCPMLVLLMKAGLSCSLLMTDLVI